MKKLIAIAFPGQPHRAAAVRQQFVGMSESHLIDLHDAVVVRRDGSGKIHLDQIHDLTAQGAMSGAFWGVLLGLIFSIPLAGPGALFLPLISAGLGAGAGALSGRLSDIGINDDFMRRISSTLTPGSSALFVLAHGDQHDRLMEELRGVGGEVLTTNLSRESEERLQEVLTPLRQEVARAEQTQAS